MSNEILIYGEVGTDILSSQSIKAQLAGMDQDEELIVRIDSPGGSVFEGFSIYNALKDYPGPKRCIVESAAFSIASYIAMAFSSVEIAENGYLMIHNPMVSSSGDDEDHRKDADLLAKLKESMVKAYSSRTGKSEDEVRQLMKEETYYDANEAKQNGFVSQVSGDSVTSRIVARNDMPYRVVASLLGEKPIGDTSLPKDKPMAETKDPVAASVSEIQAAFPKLSDSFVLNCVKKEMPMASVASAAAEELLKENEGLKAIIEAMEEEQEATRAKAAEEEQAKAAEDEEMEEIEEETATAKAKARGNAPIAGVSGGAPKTFTDQWAGAIEKEFATAMSRAAAVKAANRKNPGLRQRMLEEANA